MLNNVASYPAGDVVGASYRSIAMAFGDELEAIAETGGAARALAGPLLEMAGASNPTAKDVEDARSSAAALAQFAVDECALELDAHTDGQPEPPLTDLGLCAMVFMEPTASTAQIGTVAEAIRDVDGFESLEFTDQDAALDEFRRLFADQPELLEGVEPEALPASFRAVRGEPWGPDQIDHLEAMQGVRQVEVGTENCG